MSAASLLHVHVRPLSLSSLSPGGGDGCEEEGAGIAPQGVLQQPSQLRVSKMDEDDIERG